MCSRIFLSTASGMRVSCRTLDWYVSDEPIIWALPAGLARRGVPGAGALEWTSRHASLAVSGWDATTSEGVNDAGLAAHLLYLEQAAWEAPDQRPALGNLMWAQWALDNCASVGEVLAAVESVRIVDVPARGSSLGLHLAVEDRHGDAAVVEVLPGGVVVHEGRDARVLTNDPPLDQQLAGLSRYAPFGGAEPLPGDVDPVSRFVRGTYFLDHLPETSDADEALAGAVSVIRSMSVPFGAPSEPFGTYPTWWVSATDLDAGLLFFQSTQSPFAVWIDLPAAVARASGAGPMAVDPRRPDLAGDILDQLQPRALPY